MRSLVGTIINKAPVPYAGRGQVRQPWWRPGGTEAHLRAMGSVGTLFAIVDRLATSTAAPDWHLYRTAKPGQRPEDREEVTAHLALDIWRKPNDHFTQQLLIETFQQHYELVGEAWWVIARDPRMRSIPLEIWPVRPDRIEPIPDRDNYLAGYVYTSPDGEQVPLELDEVIQIRRPNPVDPYRGIGPVQTILADLHGVQMSAEWNANFFANSAEPGGIVEIDKNLSDPEFNQLRDRWNEGHKGVSNAHRVAFLEQGAKWVERHYSQRDMQFVELRSVSREVIREAFGIPKFAIGDVEDVNRSTSEASKAWFAEQLTVPRLERIKQALNHSFLPLFGATGKGVEFDYESPVPADKELGSKVLTGQATAAAALVTAGYYPPEVLAAVGLPELTFGMPGSNPDRELLVKLVTGAPSLAPLILPLLGFELPPVAAPAAPSARLSALAPPAHQHALPMGPRNEADLPPDELPDVSPMLDALDAALEKLLAKWEGITAKQKAALVKAVKKLIADGDVPGLADLTVDSAAAAAALTAAMTALAATAGDQIVAEAAAQGVDIAAATVAAGALAEVAGLVAKLLADELKVSAARAAMAANSTGATAAEVADAVAEHLDSLSDANARKQLGGAMHGSMNAARIETLRAAPEGAVYASERNDSNTCTYCREVNGRWLGNTSDMGQVERSYPGGAYGGYVDCLGGVNCRGTITGVWRPKQTGGGNG